MFYNLKKYDIIIVDLPEQPATTKGENGRPLTVTGTEEHGDRPCVIVAVQDSGRSVTAIPMTSALNAAGREKHQHPPKTWVRVIRKGVPFYVLTEQVRYVCRGRILVAEPDDCLMGHDQEQLELKLRALLGFI
jgi:hypothetical protein